jgi:hypothetical protein
MYVISLSRGAALLSKLCFLLRVCPFFAIKASAELYVFLHIGAVNEADWRAGGASVCHHKRSCCGMSNKPLAADYQPARPGSVYEWLRVCDVWHIYLRDESVEGRKDDIWSPGCRWLIYAASFYLGFIVATTVKACGVSRKMCIFASDAHMCASTDAFFTSASHSLAVLLVFE